MERFRELRGFVQRFGGGVGGGGAGVGGGSEVVASREETDEMLKELPLTKAFVEGLPRSMVIEKAASNDAKAAEALQLVKHVDELVESHVSAAKDLKEYVSQISTMKSEIDKSFQHAKSLQNTLLELESMVADAEFTYIAEDLREIQAAEDMKFEMYARARRAELAKKKQEYAQQLESFERERISVLSEVELSEGSSSRRAPRSPMGKLAAGLESVDIHDLGNGELDDFLDGGGGQTQEQTSSSAQTPPPTVLKSRKPKKGAKPTKPQVPSRKPVRANPGIMADEDIEDDEDIQRHYTRR